MTTRSKIRFKSVTSQQSMLFPCNLGDKIRPNHPVRVVNQIVDQLNLDDILSTYKGGGTSSYHPRVMLKILFYSYLNNIYSCRKIACQLEENIYYMWISGNCTPNFRTINDFRGKKLKGKIQSIFSEFVKIMSEMGYVSLDRQYIDGTKIEAASNKYTFVWRGSTEKYKEKLEVKIDTILKEIEQSIAEDNAEEPIKQEIKEELDAEQLRKKVKQLNQRISELTNKQQKQLKTLEQEHLPRLKKYEKQLRTLGQRNSYSKTDTDATFMRMKEDHMKNGQLKPAYNVQISTDNQIVTNFSLHQRAGDTATMIPHLEQFHKMNHQKSSEVIADAGYGSEQNYDYLKDQEIQAFVKYNYFHKEQKRSFKNNPFLPSNLYYNKQEDYLVCPMGQHMRCISKSTRKSDLGYNYQVSIYEAKNCDECPLRTQCHKSKYNRRIELNHRLIEYRRRARKLLMSEKGLYHRSMRPIEPEAVFGQIKFNNKFNRFTLKGLSKVEVEFGLVVLSHNLRKLAQIVSKNLKIKSFQHFFPSFQQLAGVLTRILEKIEVMKRQLTVKYLFPKCVA